MINLENISRKGLFWLTVLHWVLYSGLAIFAPCLTILTRYGMIGEKIKVISGIGICILVIFAFIGLNLLKKQANKIPVDAYLWQARVKAILNLIFSILVPIICLLVIMLIKDDMMLATSVIKTCVWYLIGAFVEDCILGSSCERENTIRNNSKRDKEKAKRTNKV